MRIGYRLSTSIIRFLMKILFGMKIVGSIKMDNTRPGIIAANHQSYFDPPFLGSVLNEEVFFLAKKELFNNKIFAKLIKYYNTIPIKRGVLDKTGFEHCERILKNNNLIMIFPEGSRKSFSAKAGIGKIAMDTNAVIYPVKIENITDLKGCILRKKRLTFIFGEPIEPEYYQHWDKKKANYQKLADKILSEINKLSIML